MNWSLFRDEPPPKPQQPPTPERAYTPPTPPDHERTPTQEYEQHLRELLEPIAINDRMVSRAPEFPPVSELVESRRVKPVIRAR